MEKNQLTYTTIIHSARNKLGLSNNEYIFCDTIYHLSNNPEYKYCIMSKEKLGEVIGVSKQAIHKLIIKMIELGLIEKEETLKGLKTTKKWYNTVILKDESTKFTDSKESLPSQSTKFTPTVKKVYSDSKESLLNNNIYNNNINNNINITSEDKPRNDTQELLNMFYENINPNIKFQNKTLRADAEFLVNHYPIEKLQAMILYIKEHQGEQFFPNITTPSQLRDKMAQVINYKKKESKTSKIIKI